MKFIELYNLERRNNDDEMYILHFYRNGDWWRAYEWSAYLATLYPNIESLVPIRKKFKDVEDGIIYVGMPSINSMNKYFPDIGNPIAIGESHLSFDIRDKLDGVILNIDSYEDTLRDFKLDTPIRNKKTDANVQTHRQIDPIKQILQEIMAYPLETNSLIANTEFLSNVKAKILRYTL